MKDWNAPLSHVLQKFPSGATRSPSNLRYDLIPPAALRAIAERFGIGALIHGDTNWQRGIPFSVMLLHIQEHIERFKQAHIETRRIEPKDGNDPFDYTDGDVENLAAVAWGACALIYYLDQRLSILDDRPFKKG